MSVKKTMMVSGVAMATLGLSTCSDNGAVDPAPAPLDCKTLDKGQRLVVSGTLVGQEMTVLIGLMSDGTWQAAPSIDVISGGSATGVTLDDTNTKVTLSIALDAGATNGSFSFAGVLEGWQNDSCAVSRTFNFVINNGTPILSQRELPLGSRERAAIVITHRDGREVQLAAAGATHGAAVGWTATGGLVESRAEGVTWRLPEEPGLYQIELLVDRGRHGLVIDTLTLEVG